MRFPCTVMRLDDQSWLVRHISADLGSIEVRAPSRDQAIAKMEGELRYRLELCPCSGATYQHIAIEIIDAPSSAGAK